MQIVHKTRTQLVVEAIREKILCGEIKAGEPLRQAALATELNVSRIPVREALMQLEAEGLVKFEAHKGATASEISSKQVCEVFELRALLEAELLRHSIERLTDDDFVEAENCLAKLEDAMAAGDAMSATGELNTLFHNKLYSRAERPQTSEIVASLNQSCSRYVRMHILLAGGIETAPHEHRELLDLAKARETHKACHALKKHILSAKDDIKALLMKMEKENH
ncbi:GntR family transcriptional regulator [Aliiglaciecola sp. M165]|uniref:GntR family transcriptional regulator n=1 Tax=Aliiglaciecola sp. M165 TaxID=2593649 RepID=UPI00117D8865|nr:GntR family transcriptional regulator [Aliiglaciecola sp. M165]TRY29955.1 GntR family transcriptional regulator [Aliiglaciecola sp. M165]